MTFEWGLRQNNIDPNKDLTIDTSIAFAAMQGAFVGGTGDFVTLFEPNATQIEKLGYDGVYLVVDSKRYYPYGNVFKTILGSVSPSSSGIPYNLKEYYFKQYSL